MLGSVSMKAPEPENRLEKWLRLTVPTNLLSYTFRGAAFFETYLLNNPWLVSLTSKLIASTVLPVPGPPSMIITFGAASEAVLAAASADSNVAF